MSKSIKKGVEVVVIAGNEKGQRAKVLQVLPNKNRILLEGINKRKHFEKKTKENTQGSIVEREMPIHISNVMLATTYDLKKAKRTTTTAAN